jgi:hypothetical protein
MATYDTTTTQTKPSRMVTGLFPERASAECAYNVISTRGYTKDDVNLMMSDTTRKTQFTDTETELAARPPAFRKNASSIRGRHPQGRHCDRCPGQCGRLSDQ